MATIIQTPSGSWRTQVRRNGKYASRNFRLKGKAMEWARETEHVIDQGGEISTPLTNKVRNFGHIVDLHVADLKEVGKPIRRSKRAVLKSLKKDLGRTQLRNLNRSTLIDYGKKRAKQGAPCLSGMLSASLFFSISQVGGIGQRLGIFNGT